MNIKRYALEKLRCQHCIGRLKPEDNKLICETCGIHYPISQSLIFMGYDKTKEDEIEAVIRTESKHQTKMSEIEKHYDFAYPSYKIGLLAIRIIRNDVKEINPVAIDIGSGGGPTGMLLSDNGFATFLCEIDPNSLYAGHFWKHENLVTGSRIVCDATLLPFESSSADVVFCKEFVHHLNDYSALFREINRVLKLGGVFVMIEPTTSIITRLNSIFDGTEPEHFGHHYKTMSSYLFSLKRAGFSAYRYYLYPYRKSERLLFLNSIKQHLFREIITMRKFSYPNFVVKMIIQGFLGITNVVFLKKISDVETHSMRPKIGIIDTSYLVLDENYINDQRLLEFSKILRKSKQDIYEFV